MIMINIIIIMIITHRFSCEDSFHVLSGSTPALSFSRATRNVPLSLNVVYNVNTPIIIKYLELGQGYNAEIWKLCLHTWMFSVYI